MDSEQNAKKRAQIVSDHNYTDAQGKMIYNMARYKPLKFRLRRPDEKGKWVWNQKGIQPLPYRLHLWIKGKTILFIVDDELSVEAMETLNMQATCNHGGNQEFYPELVKYYQDRVVIIIPKNDNPGRDHAILVATRINDAAKSVRILHLPDIALKGNIVTWIEAGGSREELVQLARAAHPFTEIVPQAQTQSDSPKSDDSKPGADSPNRLPLDEPLPPFCWRHVNPRGLPISTVENMHQMLNAYGITAAYNVIQKDIEVDIPSNKFSSTNKLNCSLTKIQSLCQLNGLKKQDADAYITLIADQNHVNPVLDWIMPTDIAWDGVDRLKEFYKTIVVKAPFPEEMRDLLMRKWMISACAAAYMDEGYIGKGVLVFQGAQNVGKTAWLRSLVSKDLTEYVKEDVFLDPGNKDSVSKCVQHWIVELGELDGNFRKADIARIKGFISSSRDVLRRPYDKKETRYNRKTLFFATVNETNFLVDSTGNARFWVIPVINILQHNLDMQQVWMQAMMHFVEGEEWWLDQEQEKELERLNRGHEEISLVEELVLKTYSLEQTRTRWMTASDVLVEIVWPQSTQQNANECGRTLRKYFGDPKKIKNRRSFRMPEARKDQAALIDLENGDAPEDDDFL